MKELFRRTKRSEVVNASNALNAQVASRVDPVDDIHLPLGEPVLPAGRQSALYDVVLKDNLLTNGKHASAFRKSGALCQSEVEVTK